MHEGEYSFQHDGKTIHPVPEFINELRALVPYYATSFLEWGSGCSTLLFDELARVRGGSVVSIDDNQKYQDSVLRKINRGAVKGVCVSLTGPTASQSDEGWNYGTWPLSLGRTFDFILIDGRRRVECAVTALSLCHPDTLIALHDYRRRRYQQVTLLYETQDGSQFRTLRPQ